MKIGYCRVSTQDQDLTAQEALLRERGAEVIYSDKASGTKASRPQWDLCLLSLRQGDQLLVTRLDRVARSLKNLLDVLADLDERGVTLVVTEQGIDTSEGSVSRLLVHLLGLIAEFERSLISERTKEALRGRPRGRNGGRPKSLTGARFKRAQDLYDDRAMTVREIARVVDVSQATLYRHLTLGCSEQVMEGS